MSNREIHKLAEEEFGGKLTKDEKASFDKWYKAFERYDETKAKPEKTTPEAKTLYELAEKEFGEKLTPQEREEFDRWYKAFEKYDKDKERLEKFASAPARKPSWVRKPLFRFGAIPAMAASFCIIICLSIILPIVLRPDTPPGNGPSNGGTIFQSGHVQEFDDFNDFLDIIRGPGFLFFSSTDDALATAYSVAEEDNYDRVFSYFATDLVVILGDITDPDYVFKT